MEEDEAQWMVGGGLEEHPSGLVLPTITDIQALGYDGAFHFKADVNEQGIVEAKVASTDVVDEYGHIIDPNAVEGRQKVYMSDWAHSSLMVFFGGRPPVGVGAVWGDPEQKALMFRGEIDVDSDQGGATFRRLRKMGTFHQWSIGWRNLAAPVTEKRRRRGRTVDAVRLMKIEVGEVSPVMRGASPRTRTLRTKSGQMELVAERPYALAHWRAKHAAQVEAAAEQQRRVTNARHRFFRTRYLT